MSEVFLLDANVFMTPYQQYYRFSIAPAKAHQYTLVTQEIFVHGLNASQPAKSAKIPNICGDFNVEWIDLFTMLERLEIVL